MEDVRRPTCRWEDKMKMDLKEIWREGVDSVLGPVAAAFEHGDWPSGSVSGYWLFNDCCMQLDGY